MQNTLQRLILVGALLITTPIYASNLNQFFPGSGGSSSSLSIDQLLAKLPTIDAGNSSNINVADLAELNTLFNSGAGMKAVAASSTNMNLIVASTTAMNSIASSATAMSSITASATAMPILVASSTAMAIIAGSNIAMSAISSNSTAMTTLAASATGMAAVAANASASAVIASSSMPSGIVAASSTAMTALASNAIGLNQFAISSTAMTAMTNSSTARSALYTAATKYSKLATGYVTATVHSGKGLFVRYTTFGNPAGWGEGTAGNTYLTFDGVTRGNKHTATNPYIQLTEHPLKYFGTTLIFYDYNPGEVAYIPL